MKLKQLINNNKLFDSHCHFSDLSDPSIAINNALINKVEYVIDIAVDLKNSKKILESSNKYSNIIPTAGIHPEILIPGSDLYDPRMNIIAIEKELKKLRSFIIDNNISILGECGLDYYWVDKLDISNEQKNNIKEMQGYLFEEQVKLATKLHLPLSIHSRSAEKEVMNILESYIDELDIVILHSFTSDYEDASLALEMGIYLGVNGIITYRSSENLRNMYKRLLIGKDIKEPIDLYKQQIVLETDAPLLLPRNIDTKEKENTPAMIKYIWEFMYNLVNEV